MRKLFLSLFALLGFVLVAHGQPQDWNYVGDNYSPTEQIVYLSLSDSEGNPVTLNSNSDWIGAFIDGECRGAVQAKTRPVTNTINIYYFPLRIKGTTDDNGKTVSFRYFRQQAGSNYYTEYEVKPVTALTYENEATKGTISDLFWLTFDQPLYFSFPEKLEVGLGESIDLMQQFTWEPANATRPININWDWSYASQYIKVSNDSLTGVGAVDAVELGFYNLGDIKSLKGNYSTSVKVIKKLTGLELKPEYLNGDSVYVGDTLALSQLLRDCYIKTPADANEALTWSWDDPDAISYITDSWGEHWEPKKAGVYTLTLTGGEYSVKLKLTILNRLEDMTITVPDIHLFVGDNLSELLPYAVSFTPSEFVDKRLYISQADEGSLAMLEKAEDGTLTAVMTGDCKVDVYSMANWTYKEVNVHIHPNVTNVIIDKPNLNYEYKANGEDITQDVYANIRFAPDTTYLESEMEITTSDYEVVSCTYNPQNEGKPHVFTTGNVGTATIIITHSADRTTLVDGKLVTSTVDVKGSFTVNVVQGITGFDIEDVRMGRNDTYTIKLTPIPADARVDASKITVTIHPDGVTVPRNWTLAEVSMDDESGLSWTVTPKAVGTGIIGVSYASDGAGYSSAKIAIGQDFSQAEGWKWVTPFGGDVNDIDSIYGDNLQEMRSQTALVYNDPVYGYFGDLQLLSQLNGYKVKVKDGQSVEGFNLNVNYVSDPVNISLGEKWNWIGLPYQYDHALADALGNDNTDNAPTKGDRIVSKDNGFAEFNGQDWEGSLVTLTAGEAYLYYNSVPVRKTLAPESEASLGQPEPDVSPAKAYSLRSDVWNYNSTRFADNMTIVADLGQEYSSSRYSIGAYIGDECRGEGVCVGGKWFITVHGDAGRSQQVTFRLYDTMTGVTRMIDGSQPFSMMAGTLSAPIRLSVGTATGIDTLQDNSSIDKVQLFTIDGKRVVGSPAPGVYIVKDGATVRKVTVK